MTAEHFTAFCGSRRVAHGDLETIATAVAEFAKSHPDPVLVLSDLTGRPMDLDLRGGPADISARYAVPEVSPPAKPSRGRPRLGVIPREVTLLERHWTWLSEQPGGASAALRRLVDQARQANGAIDDRRRAQDAAYRIMTSLAGDLPDFEEALRAFYADDPDRFETLTEPWPLDIRDHVRAAVSAMSQPATTT
jgi:uncharacterized protein